MTVSLTNGVPAMYQFTSPPTNSVSYCNITQLLFDSTDSNVNSTGLYFLKNGLSGSQNWLKITCLQEVQSLITPKVQSVANRSLNTIFQISATRDSIVNYCINVSCTLSISGGQTGTVFLEIASNAAFTTNVQQIVSLVNGNTGTLTIGLNIVQNYTGTVSGFVPAGYYCRIRSSNTSGTPTFSYVSGQETLL